MVPSLKIVILLDEVLVTFSPQRKLLVGDDGLTLEAFLARPVQFWVRQDKGKKL